MKKLDKNNKT